MALVLWLNSREITEYALDRHVRIDNSNIKEYAVFLVMCYAYIWIHDKKYPSKYRDNPPSQYACSQNRENELNFRIWDLEALKEQELRTKHMRNFMHVVWFVCITLIKELKLSIIVNMVFLVVVSIATYILWDYSRSV